MQILFSLYWTAEPPDEGVCVELGLAYANGKRCYGFKSDALIEQLQNYLETTPL